MKRPFLTLVVAVCAAALLAGQSSDATHLSVLRKITVGGDGGWDLLDIDSSSHRLFVSRGTHVMVVDVEAGKVVGDVPDTAGVHAIAIVARHGKGFTTNGRDNTVTVFDLKDYKKLASVSVGTRPDAVVYDPSSDRVFTMNAGGNDATAIDAKTNAVVGTVKFDGKPELAVADGKGRVFVNLEDKSQIESFDGKGLKTTGTWSLSPGEGPTGLAIDVKHHLLFAACDNGMMVVVDSETGKVVGTPKIGSGPDGAGFDPKTGFAFASNGQDGTLSVVKREKDGTFSTVGTIATQSGARTMVLDPKSGRIYLIAVEYTPPVGGGRRQMVPGSCTVLVVGAAR